MPASTQSAVSNKKSWDWGLGEGSWEHDPVWPGGGGGQRAAGGQRASHECLLSLGHGIRSSVIFSVVLIVCRLSNLKQNLIQSLRGTSNRGNHDGTEVGVRSHRIKLVLNPSDPRAGFFLPYSRTITRARFQATGTAWQPFWEHLCWELLRQWSWGQSSDGCQQTEDSSLPGNCDNSRYHIVRKRCGRVGPEP